jgi:hypothetical protein
MAQMVEDPDLAAPTVLPLGGTRLALPRRDPSFPSRDFH